MPKFWKSLKKIPEKPASSSTSISTSASISTPTSIGNPTGILTNGWTIFVQSLRLFEKTLESVPAPGLKAVVGAVIFVCDNIDLADQNQDDFEEIARSISQLQELFVEFHETKGLPEAAIPHVRSLLVDFESLKTSLEALQKRNRFQKVVGSSTDAQKIIAIFRKLKFSLNYITIQLTVDIAHSVEVIRRTVLLTNIRRSRDAAWNADLSGCLEGTRVDTLAKIRLWILSEGAPHIFWLNGVAGTGKSAIARTVAATMADHKHLGASFFCSRDSAERRDIRLVIPTIAFQLCHSYSQFFLAVKHALEHDVDIAYRSLNDQLQKLLIAPLKDMSPMVHPLVIIIDALDECDDRHAVLQLLDLLAMHAPSLSGIKLFVTSRPESEMRTGFTKLGSLHEKIVLHDLDQEVVSSDIKKYLNHEFGRLDEGAWLAPEDKVDLLVQQCGGLFIYAFTAYHWIERNIDKSEGLIDFLSHNPQADSAADINTLYTQILTDAFQRRKVADKQRMRSILGAILLAFHPLKLHSISRILDVPEPHLRESLSQLHSVLLVPAHADGVVRIFHASLSDYITGESASVHEFFIDIAEHHQMMTQKCLGVLDKELSQNATPRLSRESATPASSRRTYTSDELRYACAYWADHLSLSKPCSDDENSKRLAQAIENFLTTHLLHWFECMSVLGTLGSAIPCLDKVEKWTPEEDVQMHRILRDSQRFIVQFFHLISPSPMDMYGPGTWTSTQSAIRNLYM